MLLKNKVAIVTGSNRGIGKAILESFAMNGADVFACARKESDQFKNMCRKLEEKFNVNIYPVYFDFQNEDEIKEAARYINSHKKNIDILVNNAGVVNSVNLFNMTSMDKIKDSMNINFLAQMMFTQYVTKMMMRNKSGSIINISSAAAFDGSGGMLEYVSSKAAMIGATRRLAVELGPYNIRANAIAPGLTDTDMGSQMKEDLEEEVINRTIMKRKARPEEIANAVIFVASDMASYITGQVLRVDGGLLN